MRSAVRALVSGVADGGVPSKLVLPDLVGIASGAEELEVDGGVLILRTEGERFCGPERHERARLCRDGEKVYRRFAEVAARIPARYGAILVEYSLEEPAALRQDPRSLAFQNFFLSSAGVERAVLEGVLRIAGADAYVEEIDSVGVYVSMSAEFNPENRSVPSEEAQGRSARISALIGRAVR